MLQCSFIELLIPLFLSSIIGPSLMCVLVTRIHRGVKNIAFIFTWCILICLSWLQCWPTYWCRVGTAWRWWQSWPGRWYEPLSPPPSAATHRASTPASPAPLPPGCTPHRTACRWPSDRLPAHSDCARKTRAETVRRGAWSARALRELHDQSRGKMNDPSVRRQVRHIVLPVRSNQTGSLPLFQCGYLFPLWLKLVNIQSVQL